MTPISFIVSFLLGGCFLLATTPAYKGEVLGRATFEVASFIHPVSKPGQRAKPGKLGFQPHYSLEVVPV